MLLTLLWTVACHDPEDDTKDDDEPACEPATESGCLAPQVCEEVEGGDPACFDPVHVIGRVFALADEAPIEGARVVAMDVNGAPVSAVDITEVDGDFGVEVPTTRNADGTPIAYQVTLRADAAGWQSFPSAIRPSLPIDTSVAVASTGAWVVANTTTDIGLIAVPAGTGTGSIVGTCEVADGAPGALVVAGATTSVADRDGSFALYNLDEGSYEVTAFARGVNYESESVAVAEGAASEISLALVDDDTGTVTGSVQIVNAEGGSVTSVILVVESTFDASLARGEMPPGLRAGDVTGSFTISEVPRGDWVVLAAFENDLLVRDPDPSIGGTQIQHVTVTGGDTQTAEGFKVTEALSILSPSDGEQVGDAPTLSWVDDSSEDAYTFAVYDAFGQLVWEGETDRETGDDPAVPWAGPALTAGMYYQLRVTSIKDGEPISMSEDLRGVFWR